MEKEIKIYKLIDPETQVIRYIGKTIKTLNVRLTAHINTSLRNKKKTHKEAWIYSLYIKGLKPLIELCEIVNENNWTEREIFWIAFHKEHLTNSTAGGIGGLGKVYTESERLTISKRMLKAISEGKVDYSARALKISAAHKGKTVLQSTRQKLRDINLGKKQTWEQKLKTAKGGVIRTNLTTLEVVEFFTLQHAADNTPGTYKGNISSACNGRLKTYNGFSWKYKSKDIVGS